MANSERPHVLAIVGPTAIGKTSLSIDISHHIPSEVISADSRQIYRQMDIGTAKATDDEQSQVIHHLVDVVDPDQELTLSHFQRMANAAIVDIWSRGRLPMLVGGTGLYVKALLEGWTVPEVPPDQDLRATLYREAEALGNLSLHDRLRRIDPISADSIDARNVRRVIRAIEVYEATGKPFSAFQQKRPPDYKVLRIGLTMPREELYARVDKRIEAMVAAGLLDEVRALVERGYGDDLPAMSALGYREMAMVLRDEMSLEEAMMLLKRHTRRFVRAQYNWFRLSDPEIHWFDRRSLDLAEILELMTQFLSDTPLTEDTSHVDDKA